MITEVTVTISLLAGIIFVTQATIISFNGGEIGTPAALLQIIIDDYRKRAAHKGGSLAMILSGAARGSGRKYWS